MSTTKLPSTRTYRVAQAGVIYNRFTERLGLDGEDTVVVVPELATFGQKVELSDREYNRIKAIGAGLTPPIDYVKPEDDPLSYDEMNDTQLDAEIKKRGVTVTSSGADQDQPLRIDKINALVIFDQGQGRAGQPAVPGASQEPPPPPAENDDQPEDLKALKREQLNELAVGLGVESPEDLANKGEVVKAIEAKRAESA